jgi:hypothetical protein
MTGKNQLRLNRATMIQALQFFLNSRFLGAAPTVKSITQLNADTYVVQLDGPTPAKK